VDLVLTAMSMCMAMMTAVAGYFGMVRFFFRFFLVCGDGNRAGTETPSDRSQKKSRCQNHIQTKSKQQNLDSGFQDAPHLFNAVTILTTMGGVVMFLGFLAFASRRRLIVF
jgi:hypothetical protein